MRKFIVTLFLIIGLSIGSLFITSLAYAHEDNITIENAQSMFKSTGWYQDKDGDWHYFDNGRSLDDQWLYYNGKWYYFNEIGVMMSNISKKVGDRTYLFSSDGAMYTGYGWIGLYNYNNTSCNWFYAKGDGTVKTEEWIYYNENWYYFNDGGFMESNGTRRIGDKVYMFSNNGTINKTKGWINIFNNLNNNYEWYYGNGDGTVKVGQWLYENGYWYYFRNSTSNEQVYGSIYGTMISNSTEEIDGKTYLFDSNGHMDKKIGWIKYGNDDFIYGNGDGTVKSGEWYFENGKWYYFMNKQQGYYISKDGNLYFYSYFGGQMLRNVSREISGKIYTFNNGGVCVNP